jgi:hypothetical protein
MNLMGIVRARSLVCQWVELALGAALLGDCAIREHFDRDAGDLACVGKACFDCDLVLAGMGHFGCELVSEAAAASVGRRDFEGMHRNLAAG